MPDATTRDLQRAAGLAGVALVLGYIPMARWEARMKAGGGPGITGLQLAPDARAARAVLSTWGVDGRRAATEQTWADFAWMHTYGVTGTALVELARRRTRPGSWWAGSGRVVRLLPYAAVACDVVEGVGQLDTLRRWEAPDERVVARTRAVAIVKYASLLVSIGYALGAATVGRPPAAAAPASVSAAGRASRGPVDMMVR